MPAFAVMVFGGSCFMGRLLVRQSLIDRYGGADGHRVVVMNRGGEYWGDDAHPEQYLKPGQIHVRWDRSVAVKGAAPVTALLSAALKGVEKIVVVDFSCDDPMHAANGFDLLRTTVVAGVPALDLLHKYILISTDSVYQHLPRVAVGTLVDEEWPQRMGRSDRYGDEKAAIERWFLKEANGYFSQGSAPHGFLLTLRLPDVVGPFDSTPRWWATQLWGAVEPKRCYVTRASLERRVSFVYAWDVIAVVKRVVDSALDDDATLRNFTGFFNLSSPPITLAEAVAAIANVPVVLIDSAETPSDSSASTVTSSDDDEDDCCLYYPSVTIPPLDASRAAALLGFSATPWSEVVAQTRCFFESMPLRGPEYRRALSRLPRWIRVQVRKLASKRCHDP